MLPMEREPQQVLPGRYPAPDLDLTMAGVGAMLRRRRLLLLGCVLLTVLLVGAYTLLVTPVYQATAVLRFDPQRVNLPQLLQEFTTEDRISTEIEVLQGRRAADEVIDSLGLRLQLRSPRRARLSELFTAVRVDPAADSATLLVQGDRDSGFTVRRLQSTVAAVRVSPGEIVHLGGVTLVPARAALAAGPIELRVVSREDAARGLGAALKVTRPARDADLITVRFRASDPVLAAAAANLLAEGVIVAHREVQRVRTGSTVRYLRQQLDSLDTQLRTAEDNLSAYRERAMAVDPQEQARTQVGRLAQLQADRGALDAERWALARLVEQMQRSGDPDSSAQAGRLIAFPTLLRNPVAAQLLGSLVQIENERAALLLRRTSQDPDVQMLTARIREINGQLQGIARTYLDGLTNQVAALDSVAKGFGSELDRLPDKEVQTARREREVRVLQDMYTLLQTRLKESEITEAMEDPSVRIVDPAVVPERPERPRPVLYLGLSLVLGSLLGVTLALGREWSDRAVRSRADALSAGGLPVLGAIPRATPRRARWLLRPGGRGGQTGLGAIRGQPKGRIAVDNTPRGRAATRIAGLLVTQPDMPGVFTEAFNQLQANLTLAHQDRPLKVVVFTSPLPGEGKTLSAINFALTVAGRGQRVLLIDADLHCGLVNLVFGSPRQPGFSELLAAKTRFENATLRLPAGEAGELVILPSGTLHPAGRALALSRVREVLVGLATKVDLVVIDTPPINVLADAAILGAASDGVVLVVRAGRTQSDALRYAMDQLSAGRAPVVGTLLNDIDLRRNSSDDRAYRYMAEVSRYGANAPAESPG